MVTKTMKIAASKKKGHEFAGFAMHRRQLPMTPAYVFTEYRAQGQTIRKVVVDIANTPNGEISLFNAYVALSRSRGRETIRLLRKYDPNLFKKELPHDLIREDERLERLDQQTREWWDRQGENNT